MKKYIPLYSKKKVTLTIKGVNKPILGLPTTLLDKVMNLEKLTHKAGKVKAIEGGFSVEILVKRKNRICSKSYFYIPDHHHKKPLSEVLSDAYELRLLGFYHYLWVKLQDGELMGYTIAKCKDKKKR